MKVKQAAKIIVFCLIFVILFNYVYRVLSWKDTAGDFYSSMESFYELDENVVDVLFLGSSHCYCSINNSYLWDNYGISSFSLAISGQDLASTYYCFKEALKTQKPKVVCVDAYGVLFDGYGIDGNLYRNTLPYKLSLNSYYAVKEMAGEKAGDILLKWPIIHTRYAELQKDDFQEEKPIYLGYHAEYQTSHIGEIVPYWGEETLPISESGENWIRKIIALAQESDTQLCFFVAPFVAGEQDNMKLKYTQNIAEENNIPFVNLINLRDELALDPARDFIDAMHTNYFGAEKVSAYMGEFLWCNYDLENHYEDEKYAVWEEDLKVRNHEWNIYLLQSTGLLWDYFDVLNSMEEYIYVITTTGNYLDEYSPISEYLDYFGITEEFYESGGLWVIEDKEVTYKNLDSDFLYYDDLGECNLAVGSEGGNRNITVDFQQYQRVTDGINILVYDKVLGKVVDAVGFNAQMNYAGAR